MTLVSNETYRTRNLSLVLKIWRILRILSWIELSTSHSFHRPPLLLSSYFTQTWHFLGPLISFISFYHSRSEILFHPWPHPSASRWTLSLITTLAARRRGHAAQPQHQAPTRPRDLVPGLFVREGRDPSISSGRLLHRLAHRENLPGKNFFSILMCSNVFCRSFKVLICSNFLLGTNTYYIVCPICFAHRWDL